MSTEATAESDSSTGTRTKQRFSWDQLTLRARGPVERVQRLDEDWTMRADVELELERPIRDRRDFVAVVLPANWINGTGFVVGYLLDEIDVPSRETLGRYPGSSRDFKNHRHEAKWHVDETLSDPGKGRPEQSPTDREPWPWIERGERP